MKQRSDRRCSVVKKAANIVLHFATNIIIQNTVFIALWGTGLSDIVLSDFVIYVLLLAAALFVDIIISLALQREMNRTGWVIHFVDIFAMLPVVGLLVFGAFQNLSAETTNVLAFVLTLTVEIGQLAERFVLIRVQRQPAET